MKSAGFVPIIDVRPCPRPLTLGLQRQVHVHQVSRALTIPHVTRSTAAPQDRQGAPFHQVGGS